MRLALLAVFCMTQVIGQVVITDSGSTNRRGKTVTLGSNGHALVEGRDAKVKMKLESDLHTRFMKDLEAAMPLDQLNVHGCAKSASFGSRTFVTYKGVRSPDISCQGQTDPAVIALQKDVVEIMSKAQAKMPQAQGFR